MRTLSALALGACVVTFAAPAAAQSVSLEFIDGKVRLNAQNVSISQILAEWSKRGRTTIVNGERVPGPPVTLELQDVSEQHALDVVLRGVSGYLVASREEPVAGASSFDRILILPTSARPTTTATPAPGQQAIQVQDNLDEDQPPPTGAPGARPIPPPRVPPANLPPGVQPGAGAAGPPGIGPQPAVPGRPPVPEPDNIPDPQPAAPPPSTNPFVTPPGAARPGVVTPGQTSAPPGSTTPGSTTPGSTARPQ